MNNNNNQLSALAILSVTVIAIVMMTLTAFMNTASAQDAKPYSGNVGMGVSVLDDMAGVNFEFSGIQKGEGKGGYFGLEYGHRGRGTDDFFSFYGGKAFRIAQKGQIRLGATLGGASYGNTVTDLTRWGMGYVVGTDGQDYLIAGADLGTLFPIRENGAVSAMCSYTTMGPIYRLTLNLNF